VAAQNPADEELRSGRPPARGGLGRFLFRLAGELFGGSTESEAKQAKPAQVLPEKEVDQSLLAAPPRRQP